MPLFLILLAAVPLRAEQTPAGSAHRSILIDSSAVVPRLPAPAAIDAYRNRRDFQYGEYKAPESFLEVLWSRFNAMLRRIFGEQGASTFWEVVMYAVLAAALIGIVRALAGGDGRGLFLRRERRHPADVLADEDIGIGDFETRIAEAVRDGRYREAVRLQYLWTLRHLSDSGIIVWRPGRTNHDYSREISDASLRRRFEHAALLFDYVWYGEFPLDADIYRNIREAIERARA